MRLDFHSKLSNMPTIRNKSIKKSLTNHPKYIFHVQNIQSSLHFGIVSSSFITKKE